MHETKVKHRGHATPMFEKPVHQDLSEGCVPRVAIATISPRCLARTNGTPPQPLHCNPNTCNPDTRRSFPDCAARTRGRCARHRFERLGRFERAAQVAHSRGECGTAYWRLDDRPKRSVEARNFTTEAGRAPGTGEGTPKGTPKGTPNRPSGHSRSPWPVRGAWTPISHPPIRACRRRWTCGRRFLPCWRPSHPVLAPRCCCTTCSARPWRPSTRCSWHQVRAAAARHDPTDAPLVLVGRERIRYHGTVTPRTPMLARPRRKRW